MTILTVDPNSKDLNHLTNCLSLLHPGDKVRSYSDPMLAYQYAFNHKVEAVYAAVNMKRLDGLTLAKMLREDQPDMRIYLVAKDNAHRVDAIRVMADGYLVKPVTATTILQQEADTK